ncbi:MAG: transposase [Pyrinomonadaceae bacterium]
MTIWDDNEYPLAYLITFRTYGTWQHGDERGSIDRYHNKFRGERVPTNAVMKKQHDRRLKSQPVKLDGSCRPVVEGAIREVCAFRGWRLFAINVRTNHVHVVVWIQDANPASALRDFKAYSTRALRARGLWEFKHGPWVDSGSKRYLWKESAVHAACDYVVNGQGDDLPDFI